MFCLSFHAIAVAYALSSFSCLTTTEAMTASPTPFTTTQYDGQQISLYIRGNEYRNYLTDLNGYIVMQNSDSAITPEVQLASDNNNIQQNVAPTRYTYATIGVDGNIVSSGIAVGTVDSTPVVNNGGVVLASFDLTSTGTTTVPLITEPNVAFGVTPLGASSEHRRRSAESRTRRQTTSARGRINNLVLMIRFSDCQYQTRTDTTSGLPTVQDLNVIFNGATNSVKDVFKVNSYGALDVSSVFSDWITVDMTLSQASDVCCNYI